MTMTDYWTTTAVISVVCAYLGWAGRGGWDRYMSGGKIFKLPRWDVTKDVLFLVAIIVMIYAAFVAIAASHHSDDAATAAKAAATQAKQTSDCTGMIVGQLLDYQNAVTTQAKPVTDTTKEADLALKDVIDAIVANATDPGAVSQADALKLFQDFQAAQDLKVDAESQLQHVRATKHLPTRHQLLTCIQGDTP